MSVVTEIDLEVPRLHPAQIRIRDEARRFNVISCGRRFGKTIFGIDRILETVLEGQPTGWFAPTYKYLSEAWRDMLRLFRPIIANQSKTEGRIELITGGSVECWTLEDADAGRSRKYSRVVIDEAGRAKNLEIAWQESIRPTLTDLRGDAFLTSTPKGRNFFWRAFCLGLDAAESDWMAWSSGPQVGLPTAFNPHIDAAEVEAARRQLPERVFRQEYLAEFIEEGAGVFRRVRESVDVGRVKNDLYPIRNMRYTIGVDLARVDDFTVIAAFDPSGRQVYFERFNQISWERQIGAIISAVKRWDGADVILDSTGVGDPILERLCNAGIGVIPYHFTNASKNQLIDNLAMQIEQGRLRLMDHDVQTNELLAFEYELTPSRNIKLGAPEGTQPFKAHQKTRPVPRVQAGPSTHHGGSTILFERTTRGPYAQDPLVSILGNRPRGDGDRSEWAIIWMAHRTAEASVVSPQNSRMIRIFSRSSSVNRIINGLVGMIEPPLYSIACRMSRANTHPTDFHGFLSRSNTCIGAPKGRPCGITCAPR